MPFGNASSGSPPGPRFPAPSSRCSTRRATSTATTRISPGRRAPSRGPSATGFSYHADRQKLKTSRGDPWTFDTLRRYAEEAPAVGGREAALWIVKDLRRGGRPDVDALAKRAGVAPYAERLRAGTELDTLEEDVRAGR